MKESSLSRDIDQSSFLGFSSTYKNTQVLQNGIIAAAGDTHHASSSLDAGGAFIRFTATNSH
jgi:hypothetical protein